MTNGDAVIQAINGAVNVAIDVSADEQTIRALVHYMGGVWTALEQNGIEFDHSTITGMIDTAQRAEKVFVAK